MITPGLCSITLRDLSPERVVEISANAGLRAMEWWGAGHAKAGDLAAAKRVAQLTADAGLVIAAVLDSASAMGAPTIRVWAGEKNPERCSAEEIERVIKDLNRIADLAQSRSISVTLEFHGGTLTNSGSNAHALANRLPHPNIFFSWQPPHGFTAEQSVEGLQGLLGRLSTIHVYHWTIGSYERSLFNESERELQWPADYHFHPLQDGRERWESYLRCAAEGNHCALLEFPLGNSVEQVREDAAVLVELCKMCAK